MRGIGRSACASRRGAADDLAQVPSRIDLTYDRETSMPSDTKHHRIRAAVFAAALLCAIVLTARADDKAAVPAIHDITTAEAQARKTTLKEAVAVPMDVASGRPAIDVMIGGKGPFRFVVDTGASHTVINTDLATELGLKSKGKTQLGDPMNPHAIDAEIVELPSLEIGGARFEGVQAAAWDQGSVLGRDGPRGVLGFPVFHDVLLTFDYVDKQMRLTNGKLGKADGKSVLDYRSPNGIPAFTISVGGTKLEADLDTGSGGYLSVPKGEQDKLKFAGPLQVVGRARTVNTEMVLRGAQLDGAFEIGQFKVDNPFIMISDELPHANVGSRALAPFALTFDQRASVVRFEQKGPLVAPPAPGKGQAHGPSPSGLAFGVVPGSEVTVAEVAPGSPGEKAGLKAGDQVVKINDIAIAALDEDALRKQLRTSPLKLTLQSGETTRDVTVTFP
jgi:predicted aspartyl protease